MTNKEISIRSIVFLVIGLLLVLSLVICINIVSSEKDLVATKATVISIKEDKDGTGKNDITVVYDVNNVTYKYNFYYKDNVKVDEEVDIYYHEKNITSVQLKKTSKYIFICPLLGIILCVIGLFELFSKNKDDEEEIVITKDENLNTKVVAEDERTQTIKIINDIEESNYVKTSEETEEVPVREIINKLDNNVIEDDFNTRQIDHLVDMVRREVDEPKKEKVKVIPSSYKISDNYLIFKEKGKPEDKLDISKIRSLVKTINSEKKLIKITIKSEQYVCIFTDMPKINLDKFASELHNTIKIYNKNLLEEIDYKEW